jgi:hypothetical protein
MQEDDLDSIIANLEQSFTNSQTSEKLETNEGIVHNRPRLRKIKRPKIRPMNQEDVSVRPSPVVSSDENVNDSSNLNSLTPSFSQQETEEASKTSLITSDVAKDLTDTIKKSENPYILEGLPPELDYENGSTSQDEEDDFINHSTYMKKNISYILAGICLFIGLFIGKAFFSSQVIENRGLEGIVINPEVPSGRPRCGLTDKNQACIFYIMNWYKQELNGRDFYKLAAQLTGREEYMIETENLRYAQVKIKPGHFAQLNIPAIH